ncbi:MAG: bifunctional phosphoribosyl-AMP cyclohydrolase/phosphoribosyl-ATP diphosphatase HisIE [Bacteroidetes bacterium]|nr:bifunctional phosphoribosyl-AMP cyclohydrolase/phosphoribosyl-ATP diphosphatase HisIE [Bacteroidota bacterium]
MSTEVDKGANTLNQASLERIDWDKAGGLVPAIIQDAANAQVLMLGYMNRAAAEQTLTSGKVTFFSRSKSRLWTKGETSGNFLKFVSATIDCDHDTILVQAHPAGPACHTGARTCFTDTPPSGAGVLAYLDAVVHSRRDAAPGGSYTTTLFAAGKARVAQKVGEEGVELALARMKDDREEIANEAADLLFHMMVLLADAEMSLDDAVAVLRNRHR